MENFSNGKPIGKITHYFGKIGVAVIELEDELKVGEEIKIVGGDKEFVQIVDSLEVNHKKIEKAKAGEAVGLKVIQKVKPGYRVYKI